MYFKKLTGPQIGSLVLATMKPRVDAATLRKAMRIRWPNKCKILGTSTKVRKSLKKKALTAVVYLAPAEESVVYGGRPMCSFYTIGCASACLGTKKRLAMDYGYNSKAWKTLLWLYRPDIFKVLIDHEISLLENRAKRNGWQSAVRLNGTSDELWEIKFPEIFKNHPATVFYDYTKIEQRMYKKLPANYSLTFSRSEDNEDAVERVLDNGGNVAVVFNNLPKAMRNGYKKYSVCNGDITDYRPSDKHNVIVGLSIKSDAKDDSGFFINNGEIPKRKRA